MWSQLHARCPSAERAGDDHGGSSLPHGRAVDEAEEPHDHESANRLLYGWILGRMAMRRRLGLPTLMGLVAALCLAVGGGLFAMNHDSDPKIATAAQVTEEDRAAAREASADPTTWYQYVQRISPSFVGLSQAEAVERADTLGIIDHSIVHADEPAWITGGAPPGHLTMIVEKGLVARLFA